MEISQITPQNFTLASTGALTVKGALTQTIGGTNKFTDDTPGTISMTGVLNVGTSTPYQAGKDVTV